MDIYFRIIEGSRTNDVFKIQKGATVGRSKANINLLDTKASSLHGRIDEIGGELYYMDSTSTNGSFVDGKRIQKIKLEPGLKISIGNSVLEVISEFDLKKTASVRLSEWREKIYELLQKMELPQAQTPLDVFQNRVLVRITAGDYAGLEWRVGYGPRFLGPGSSDLCLPDSSLPDLCLKIFLEGSAIKVEDLQKKTVATLSGRLNIVLGQHALEFLLEG